MIKSNLMPEHCLILVPVNPRHSICPTFLAQVMPKSTENFGMTFAKNWTYRAPEICRNGNESTFRQNIGHSYPCKQYQHSIYFCKGTYI